MPSKVCLIALVSLLLALATGACEQDGVRQVQAASGVKTQQTTVGQDDGLRASVVFCRRLGRKTGARIGEGRDFTIGRSERVTACMDFRRVVPERLYAVHLVWLKPTGREIFRKYAEVVVSQEADAWRASIEWRKAEDFSYSKREERTCDAPGFELTSSLDIAPDRQRQPGTYMLRVYLHRELLLQETFELHAP